MREEGNVVTIEFSFDYRYKTILDLGMKIQSSLNYKVVANGKLLTISLDTTPTEKEVTVIFNKLSDIIGAFLRSYKR